MMTHDELVKTINIALAPIDLEFARVEDEPEPERSILVLSRLPGFDEDRPDVELATMIRKRLDVEPNIAEATQNLDISLE